MKYSARLILVIITIIGIFGFANHPHIANASANITIWWPTNNSTLSNVQPFKALVDNMSTDNYTMYWQVDGGQLNNMDNNNTDSPHKEASVDVSGWNWKSDGNYLINIIAKDNNGNTIATKSINIITNVQSSTNNSPSVPGTSPVKDPVVVANPITNNANDSDSNNQTSPVKVNVSVPNAIVWWPTNDVVISGSQKFKVIVEGEKTDSYSVYWSVDNGQYNLMDNNDTDYPHKESLIDLSNWKWNNNGPYNIDFIAKDLNDKQIGKTTVTIYTGDPAMDIDKTPTSNSNPPINAVSTTTNNIVLPTNPDPTPITSSNIGDPLSGMTFYVNPNSNAATQSAIWKISNPTEAAQMEKISSQPEAKWLGDWNSDIQSDTKNYVDSASSLGEVPVLIAYNIPNRDCNGYSSGGAANADAYKNWITGLTNGIGSRKTVVVLEPDALAMMDCLSNTDQTIRYSLLNYAIDKLKSNSNTVLYIDAGNSNWIGANDMANRLKLAGIDKADGFALNVSNFYWTQDLINFGQNLSKLTDDKHFIIDTSRNGLGPDGSNWCNPQGRALGQKVTTSTNNSLVDAFMWLKNPGESDGTCNGGPSAGVWWPDYALGLSERASY